MHSHKNDMLKFLKVNWPIILRSHTFKYQVIQLDRELIDYIQADWCFISESLKDNNKLGQQEGDECPRFKEFELMMKDIFDDYDSVFIKLNWWAPKDCSNWAIDLKFDNLHDIFMALKTSGLLMDMVTDYEEWFQGEKQQAIQRFTKQSAVQEIKGFLLEIRKWYKLNPLNEYRCFVYKRQLVGISQKNLYQISKSSQHHEKLTKFVQEVVIPNFTEECYVVDLFVDIPPRERILIVDIGPWREFSSPKLFSWEELETSTTNQMRLVENQSQIQHVDHSCYHVPTELSDYTRPEDISKVMEQISKDQE